ncbi:hypothetical protein [Dactylosporangium sp. NPDC051541]|uniref:hypothetical protein n=1 Tax=Dactylosporangium sp. NPDC051541 TaxID=3363977 RepID=UPI0037BD6B08
MLSAVDADAPAASVSSHTPWHRRVSTWLLAGWCAGWMWYLWSAQATRYGCPPGQKGCYQGPIAVYWWLWGAAGAVLLAGLCIVEARRPALDSPVSPERRTRRRWLILGGVAGAVIGANLVLLGPMADNPFCAEPVHVNRAMAYPLNCDSHEFMRLAHHPRDVLDYHNPRQSRPGYVALSALAERTIGPVAHALRLDRLYKMPDRAQFPLVAINLAATAAAIALLAWQLARLGTPGPASVALCAFLAVNGITTAFTWTPHQQTFALLVPAATVLVGRRLLLSRSASWRWPALAGLAAGVASLVYGSFLITAAVAGLILLYQRRWLALTACIAAFAAPQLAWIAVCKLVTGDYYNQESKLYDEFIWLPIAAKQGPGPLWRGVHDMTLNTGRELFTICMTALLLVTALAVTAVLLRVRLAALTDPQRATVLAAALTAAAAVAFAWGIGLIADRLMFHALPALLVVAGWIIARITTTRPRAGHAITAAVVLFTAWTLTNEILTPGPYS